MKAGESGKLWQQSRLGMGDCRNGQRVTIREFLAFWPAKGQGRAAEVTINDVDQFARVRKMKKNSPILQALPEWKFKPGLLKLFGETGKFPDSGIEEMISSQTN